MVRLRPVIVVVLLIFLISLSYLSVFHRKALHATLGGEALLLEVADTGALRAKGLSGHKPLESNEGMFFVFPTKGSYGFWMKDMLFPIDILWLDEDYRIVYVKEYASPKSYPEIFIPQAQARYVLELPDGFFSKYHLHIRNTLKISS